jgi:hypothetical protein
VVELGAVFVLARKPPAEDVDVLEVEARMPARGWREDEEGRTTCDGTWIGIEYRNLSAL